MPFAVTELTFLIVAYLWLSASGQDLTGELQVECDEGNVKCYSLFRGQKTWQQAFDSCQKIGRHLAIINNECSQKLVEKFREKGHAWVALKRADSNAWTDIEGHNFQGEVVDYDRNDLCVMLNVDVPLQKDITLISRSCNQDSGWQALCQSNTTKEECGSPGYYRGGTCYKLSSLSFTSQLDAIKYCEKYRHGSLAYTQITAKDLQSHFKGEQSEHWFWIGIQRHPWLWYRDGTARNVTYKNWRQFEGTGSGENCMHLELSLGSIWADKKCDLTSQYYVCESGQGPQMTPLTFDEIFVNLWPKSFHAKFQKSSDVYVYRKGNGDLVSTNAITNETEVIMDQLYFVSVPSGTYFISADLKYVLIAYDRRRLYRDSFYAKYKIFDRTHKILLDFPNHGSLRNTELQYAQWSDSSTALVFVVGNNLYYQLSPDSNSIQLTSDGLDKYIFNGVPDWMFEEDVLWSNKATYWSPSGARLCYARFEVIGVPLSNIPIYGRPDNMFPDNWQIAIPKAGYLPGNFLGPTTRVELFVRNLNSPSEGPQRVPPPTEFRNTDHYYTSVAWASDTFLYVTWANRAMNRSITTICDVRSMDCVKNLDLLEVNGWIFIPAVQPIFVYSGTSYLTILPKHIPGRGHWRHLAIVSIGSGIGKVRFLTDGPVEVTDILGYDSDNHVVYFASPNNNPGERHIFRVGTPQAAVELRTAVCVSCTVSPDCQYTSATFSDTGRYYILGCSGPGTPKYYLKRAFTKKHEVLEDNAFFNLSLSAKFMPHRTLVDVPLANGLKAKAEVYYPPNYNPGKLQYRMLMHVYGAPDSNDVLLTHNMWSYRTRWFSYLASRHHILVVAVDGRGTYGRGDDFRFQVYKQLGKTDVADQMATARFFKNQHYVNSSANIAVVGWSYGGMMSSLILTEDSDLFKCGLAISPVTSKRYYDVAYSERYLGFANESDIAYDNTDVSLRASQFEGKKYFIAHGTKDDNVQYQHTAQLISALTKKEIQFKQHTYIDENHDLSGYETTRHLYKAMTDFLLNDCWG